MFNGCRGLGYGGLGYNGSGYVGFGGIFMMIIQLLVVGMVLYAVFKFLSQVPYNSRNNKAINILEEKYALGEITEEEYLKKKKLLVK